jgi:hypothetical protein
MRRFTVLLQAGARLRGPASFGEKQLPRTSSYWQRVQ